MKWSFQPSSQFLSNRETNALKDLNKSLNPMCVELSGFFKEVGKVDFFQAHFRGKLHSIFFEDHCSVHSRQSGYPRLPHLRSIRIYCLRWFESTRESNCNMREDSEVLFCNMKRRTEQSLVLIQPALKQKSSSQQQMPCQKSSILAQFKPST